MFHQASVKDYFFVFFVKKTIFLYPWYLRYATFGSLSENSINEKLRFENKIKLIN